MSVLGAGASCARGDAIDFLTFLYVADDAMVACHPSLQVRPAAGFQN